MAVAEPYSACITALRAALVDAAGPFTDADQILMHAPDTEDASDPVEELRKLTTKSAAQAALLVADAGSDPGEPAGGQDTHERWKLTLYYGVRVPAGSNWSDWAKVYEGESGQYFGEFEVRKWLFERIIHQDLPSSGTVFRFDFDGRRPLTTSQRGMVICAFEVSASLVHTFTAI